MLPQQRIGPQGEPPERSDHPSITAVTGVTERDEGVAAYVPRLALGDVPAPHPLEQRLVIHGEQLNQVDPCFISRRGRRGRMMTGGGAAGRASLRAPATAIGTAH